MYLRILLQKLNQDVFGFRIDLYTFKCILLAHYKVFILNNPLSGSSKLKKKTFLKKPTIYLTLKNNGGQSRNVSLHVL